MINKLPPQPFIDKKELKELIKEAIQESLDERERLNNLPDEPEPVYEYSLTGLAYGGSCFGLCIGAMAEGFTLYGGDPPLSVAIGMTILVFALLILGHLFVYKNRMKVE